MHVIVICIMCITTDGHDATNIIVVVEWGTRIGKVVDISGISILPWWLLINRFIA